MTTHFRILMLVIFVFVGCSTAQTKREAVLNLKFEVVQISSSLLSAEPLLEESVPVKSEELDSAKTQAFRDLIGDFQQTGDSVLNSVFEPLYCDKLFVVMVVLTSGIPSPYDAWTAQFNGKTAIFFNLSIWTKDKCQTLLIHVQNPGHVIREMLRVLKPGGLLAVAEPSNIAQTHDSIELAPDDAVTLYRLNYLVERGKIALGEGNSSLGDLLPGLFAQAGLNDIQVYVGDKAATLYPPYTGDGQKEAIADRLRDAETNYYMFGLEQTRKYFLAGGGSPSEFEHAWNVGIGNLKQTRQAILERTFHSGGGHVMYLVSGRKKGRLI